MHSLRGASFLDMYNIVRHSSIKKDVFRIYTSPIFSGFSSRKITVKKQNLIHNRKRSNSRARRRIQELININFESNFSFMTLTFRDNVTSIEIANKTFTSFIKRLKYYLKHKKNLKIDFKYIATIETQKRGSIHYHLICNLPLYTNFTDVINIWKKSINSNKDISLKDGTVKIKYSSNSDIQADNLGVYLTKYLTKNFNNQEFCGKKIYSTSRNLIKPERTNYMFNFENKKEINNKKIIKILNSSFNLEPQNITKTNIYKNPYTGEDIYYLEFKK